MSYLVLGAGLDGDATTWQGLAQYHRVDLTPDRSSLATFAYLQRANHGQANTVWGRNDPGWLESAILHRGGMLLGGSSGGRPACSRRRAVGTTAVRLSWSTGATPALRYAVLDGDPAPRPGDVLTVAYGSADLACPPSQRATASVRRSPGPSSTCCRPTSSRCRRSLQRSPSSISIASPP